MLGVALLGFRSRWSILRAADQNYFLILVLYHIQDRTLLLLKELYRIQNKTFRLSFLPCRRFQEMPNF